MFPRSHEAQTNVHTARAHIEGTISVEKGLVGSLVFGVFLVFWAREPLGCFLGACSLWPGFHVSDRLPGGPGPEKFFPQARHEQNGNRSLRRSLPCRRGRFVPGGPRENASVSKVWEAHREERARGAIGSGTRPKQG